MDSCLTAELLCTAVVKKPNSTMTTLASRSQVKWSLSDWQMSHRWTLSTHTSDHTAQPLSWLAMILCGDPHSGWWSQLAHVISTMAAQQAVAASSPGMKSRRLTSGSSPWSSPFPRSPSCSSRVKTRWRRRSRSWSSACSLLETTGWTRSWIDRLLMPYARLLSLRSRMMMTTWTETLASLCMQFNIINPPMLLL